MKNRIALAIRSPIRAIRRRNSCYSDDVNGVALEEYTIVYSMKSVIGAKKAAEFLNQCLKALCGTELKITSNSKDRPEILLGLDGDDATIAAAYAENGKGIIGTTGKKVVLQGTTYSALS